MGVRVACKYMARELESPVAASQEKSRVSFGSGKLQVSPGVEVTDIFDEPAQKLLVVRHFSIGDVLAEDVAQNAPKVFVARIRHERARVRHHSDKAGEQPGIRQ